MIKLIRGRFQDKASLIEQNSVDLILSDPPYGVTACKWDSIIPLDEMWANINSLAKRNAVIAIMGQQPFTSTLISSNMKMFKYCWIWNKKQSGNFVNAKRQPLKITEDICIFYDKKITYNPHMRKGKYRKRGNTKKQSKHLNNLKIGYTTYSDMYYPTSIIEIANCSNRGDNIHPTQKPVKLMEYLIETYTNRGDAVMDFCMGSGTTGIAAINLGRDFIGIEKDVKIFNSAKNRICNHVPLLIDGSEIEIVT